MRATVFLMLVSLAATPAAAQITFTSASPPPATGSQANAVPGEGKIICEREEEIGSRLGGKKVCKTKSQWDEQRRLERENVEKVQQQGTEVRQPGG